jgi:hypothetical protein
MQSFPPQLLGQHSPPLQSLLVEQKVPPHTPTVPGPEGGHPLCAATSISAHSSNRTTKSFAISTGKLCRMWPEKAGKRHSVSNRTRFGESPLREDTKLSTAIWHQKCEDSEFVRCVNSVSAHLNLYHVATSLKSSDITAYRYCRPLTTSGRRLETCDPLSGAFKNTSEVPINWTNLLRVIRSWRTFWKQRLTKGTNRIKCMKVN